MEFGTLAAESGWNVVALQGVFRRGLSGQVRDSLVAGVQPKDLNELTDHAIELDNYQTERRRERSLHSIPPHSPARRLPSPHPIVCSTGESARSRQGTYAAGSVTFVYCPNWRVILG